jgi:hypothetical protein
VSEEKEGGRGEKIELHSRVVIDCVPSPETAAGVQATGDREAERKIRESCHPIGCIKSSFKHIWLN